MSADNKVPAKVQMFQNISADDPDVTEIESYCVNCEKQVNIGF